MSGLYNRLIATGSSELVAVTPVLNGVIHDLRPIRAVGQCDLAVVDFAAGTMRTRRNPRPHSS